MHQHTFPAVYLSDWFHIDPQHHIKLSSSCTAEFFLKKGEGKKKLKNLKLISLLKLQTNSADCGRSQETAVFPTRLQIGYKTVITLLSSKARPQHLPSSKESQANKSSPKQVEYAPYFQELTLVSAVAVQVFPCAGCSIQSTRTASE